MVKQPKVCVVGSINMDLVTTTDIVPGQGETVIGNDFKTYPGGKGANQAITAARLGADVSIVGAVGDDEFGHSLLNHFDQEGLNRDGVTMYHDVSTGIATIILSNNDNRIIVTSGANNRVTVETVKAEQEIILNSDVIILQFELAMDVVLYTTQLAHEHGIPVIVNPAPFQTIPAELIDKATYLTPNEIEYASMANVMELEVVQQKMIITLGKQGTNYTDISGVSKIIPAYKVVAIDTTGAGDTFNGALATELGKGATIESAVNFANAAAALSVTKLGAQGGMSTRSEVLEFLQERKI